MADAFFTLRFQSSVLRRADGLIWGMRVYHPKVVDTLFYLNRETGQAEELRLYRPELLKEQR